VHGHRRPEVDKAVRDQLEKIAHSTLLGLGGVPSIEFAEKLSRFTPEGLNRVFYSDSGSTAVEVALKIAFQYWRNLGIDTKKLFVTLQDAYHGDTIGSVSVGHIDLFHSVFHPLLFRTIAMPTPFPYRNPDLGADQLKQRSLDFLEETAKNRAHEIVAVVVEPIVQGAAGMIVHPEGFLKGVEEICRKYDMLLICDEVATGFGRTGKMFACEHEDVKPDLMALAKGISAGYLPLAATVSNEKVYQAFLAEYAQYKHFFHGHSYTGNALACAAAIANLEIFEEERVLEKMAPKIEKLSSLLESEIKPLKHVGDVRQKGFMTGVELAQDKEKRKPYEPGDRMAHRVCMDIRHRGVIIRNLGDVVILMPPLSITDDQLELLVGALAESIRAVTED
jgi:adenosylmethionine-8-amino-7-oxononanoate transaminase